MSLSKENIKFIDNYLKNSEVIYYDIRMEMLDHVATAVEQKMETENIDFYDAFKNYMVLNKKEVLKSNPKRFKLLGIALKNYFLYFFTLKAVVSIIAVYMFFKVLTFYFKTDVINYYGSIVVFVTVMLSFFYYHFRLKSQKIRFSSLENITSITFIFYESAIIFNNPTRFKEHHSSWFLIIFMSCLIVFCLFYKDEVKKIKSSELFKSIV